jgi:hypothetical protein
MTETSVVEPTALSGLTKETSGLSVCRYTVLGQILGSDLPIGPPDGEAEPAEKALPLLLNEIELLLGERWFGETWSLMDQRESLARGMGTAQGRSLAPTPDQYEHAKRRAVICVRNVLQSLQEGPSSRWGTQPGQTQSAQAQLVCSGENRALLLLMLYASLESLWDRGMAYQTIDAVCQAVQEYLPIPEPDQIDVPGTSDWPGSVQRAAAATVRMTLADTWVFREVNRGQLERTLAKVTEAGIELRRASLLIDKAVAMAPNDPELAARPVRQKIESNLESIRDYCRGTEFFYEAITRVTEFLEKFHEWMEHAPRVGSVQPDEDAALDVYRLSNVIDDVTTAITDVKQILARLDEDSIVIARCEPWHQLLIDIHKNLTQEGPDYPDGPAVLVPKAVNIRYCFPFAVDYSFQNNNPDKIERNLRQLDPRLVPHHADLSRPLQPKGRAGSHDNANHGTLGTRLKERLEPLFPGLNESQEPLEVEDLYLSGFWLGSGEGLYGGVKVPLPRLNIGGKPHSVWLEVSRMGNNSLCVEPEQPLVARQNARTSSFPHDVYRALRIATPWVLDEKVQLVDDHRSALRWDCLHDFARDVITATANALVNEPSRRRPSSGEEISPYVAGNLHEVIVVQTEKVLSGPGGIDYGKLEHLIGANVLLRSFNRVASTLAEWVRSPSAGVTSKRIELTDGPAGGQIRAVPSLGFEGDWFVHTGEATVFGLVATPGWVSDVYFEVGQFAATWAVLLQLWSQRLHRAIRTAHKRDRSSSSWELRFIDQEVRRRSSELRSAQLCQSQFHRHLLDALLSQSGVSTLEGQLYAQLEAAERLTDWYGEQRQHSAESARNILLLLIGLFGVFGVAGYLSLANGSVEGRYSGAFGFLSSNPGTEVAIVLFLFGIFLVIGFFLLWRQVWESFHDWLSRRSQMHLDRPSLKSLFPSTRSPVRRRGSR